MRSGPPVRSGQVRSGRVPCPSPLLAEARFWVHWCLACLNKTVFPEEVTAAGSPLPERSFSAAPVGRAGMAGGSGLSEPGEPGPAWGPRQRH